MSTSTLMQYKKLAAIITTDPVCEVSEDTQLRVSEDTTRYPFNVKTPVRMTQMVLGLADSFNIRKARGVVTLRSGVKVKLRSDGVEYDYIAKAEA